MLFRYKGLDKFGKKVSQTIEAFDIYEAKQKIKAKGIIYTSIDEISASFFDKISFKSIKKIDPQILAYFSRDLSIYLSAGISLVNAISLLQEKYTHEKKLFTFFDSILTSLQEGKNFYTALDQQSSLHIPEFYKQSIKISENSGLLQTVLLELSTFLLQQNRIKKQITQALAYPLFILFISVFMVGFMLGFIVPKITAIFIQLDQTLPKITTFVIKLGEFFSHNYIMLSSILFICTVLFVYLMKRSISFKYFIDRVLLQIPFLKTLIQFNELSRFSYMNSILIRSGVPVVQAVKLSSNILKNSVLQKIFQEASIKVVEGEKLSKILDQNNIYAIDKSFVHAVAIGEETSQLDSILQNLAQIYNESSKDKVTLFLSLLEPILMLLVGSIIGFIVIAMLLPIFSMNLG